MGKAMITEKVGAEGLFEVKILFDINEKELAGIENLIDQLFLKIRELQQQKEDEVTKDDTPDPDPEEDPGPEEDPDPEEDPIPIPDPDPPDPPEPDPPVEDQINISGIVRGFI